MTNNIWSQEFFCQVNVQSKEIAGVDKTVFTEMRKAIYEFMNNRKWSNNNYQISERIECTMIFTISGAQQGGDEFKANLNIVLQRPIYSTDYNSVVLNMIDKDIVFKYISNQNMEFVDNTYTNNLTSILAFYAYMMIGMDMDTYTLYGGSVMYEKAMAVVSSAQNSPFKGWQAFEGNKNRYHFVENLLNSAYQPLRKLLYEYHLKGLDNMSSKMETSRASILKTLGYMKQVYDKRPGLYLFQLILEAKRDEIINIFSEASPREKTEMINIMTEIDPPNGTKYRKVNER